MLKKQLSRRFLQRICFEKLHIAESLRKFQVVRPNFTKKVLHHQFFSNNFGTGLTDCITRFLIRKPFFFFWPEPEFSYGFS